MQNRLFRRTALERLSSPEQLDLLMRVTSARAWLVLLGMIVILSAIVIWAFTGSIPTTVSGNAILLRGGSGITTLSAPFDGLLNDIYIGVDDIVEEGQIIARIQNRQTGENSPVTGTSSGRVIEVLVSQGDAVTAGETLIILEPTDEDTDLQAIIYLSAADGKRVQPGMKIQLIPATVRAEEVGVMLGWVVSVGEFPESSRSMAQTLENDELVDLFINTVGEAPIEIRADLIPSRDTVTGYKWSSPRGPDTEIRSGTLADATIILDEQPPVNLVFAGLVD